MSEESSDLRSAVETAYEAATTPDTPPTPEPTPEPKSETVPVPASEPAVIEPESKPIGDEPSPSTPKITEPNVEPVIEAKPQVEPPPQSWKASIRNKHWANLDPEVRQEILRREKDVVKTFGENAQIRQFATQFSEAIRPYEARFRSAGINAVQAVERLFNADHILSSAPPVQRAQYMARMIKEYGIDIKELDSALAGEGPADPVQSQVDQLLQQRLAPLNQFIQQQQIVEQQRIQQQAQQANLEIDKMASDVVKYPHFEQVREQMADLVDFYAARNKFYPLEEIYARAVTLDPELGPQALASQMKQAQVSSAQAQHAQAQRAKAASLSVSSTKASASTPALQNNASLHDAIEAAWAAHSGR